MGYMRLNSTCARAWLAAAAGLLVLQGSAWAQTRELATRGELLDRVVAIVNDGVVLNSDLDAQVDAVSERLRQQKLELPPQNVLRQQVLERLVVQEIELQHAGRAGVKVTDEMLNNELADVAKRNNMTLSQLPDALSHQGIDYPSYREDIRKEITLTLLRQRDVLQHISITPREIDQFLDKQARTPSESNEYNVSHILIAVGQEATPSDRANGARHLPDDPFDQALLRFHPVPLCCTSVQLCGLPRSDRLFELIKSVNYRAAGPQKRGRAACGKRPDPGLISGRSEVDAP